MFCRQLYLPEFLFWKSTKTNVQIASISHAFLHNLSVFISIHHLPRHLLVHCFYVKFHVTHWTKIISSSAKLCLKPCCSRAVNGRGFRSVCISSNSSCNSNNDNNDSFFLICSLCGRSQWLRSQRHGSVSAHLLGLWVRILQGTWMFVSCECCVL
jgi:hypothetical protein